MRRMWQWVGTLAIGLAAAAHAQVEENFDSQASPVCRPFPSDSWEQWAGSSDVCGELTSAVSFSPPFSLRIVGATGGSGGLGDDTVLRFGPFEGGRWVFRIMTFVPFSAAGIGYVNVLNTYDDPVGAPPNTYRWSLQLRFDANAGLVRSDFDNNTIPLIRGQWVELRAEIDLDADSVDVFYNGVEFVSDKSWINGVSTGGLPRIQAVDLYGGEPSTMGTTGMFFDDLLIQRRSTPGPCLCDINASGSVNSQDFFDYLGLFFGSDPRADLNGDGAVTSQDFFDFLACFFSPCPPPPQTDFERFISTDPGTADVGYLNLYLGGEHSFPTLLQLLQTPGEFHGRYHISPRVSINVDRMPSISITALGLIEGILKARLAPHVQPRLTSISPRPSDALLAEAIDAYVQFILEAGTLPLQQIRLLPHPLLGHDLFWFGPAFIDFLQELLVGTKVPGSATYYHPRTGCGGIDGPDAGGAPDPYAWVYRPAIPGGPTPYNCMAWGFKCQTDRWMWPVKAPAAGGIQPILMDYGYNPTCVSCDGECPAGHGEKIMLIYHMPNIIGPYPCINPVNDLVHVMKQQGDGTGRWTSKNGQTERYNDIIDPIAFNNRHYPPGMGQRLEVRCFCR